MISKKGLSTVVTTLIIILLVLVAVGIIWGVVNNLLVKSKGKISSSTKCLDLDVQATRVAEGNATEGYGGIYNVTLKRGAGGDDEEIYAKVVFYNADSNSDVIDFGDGLLPLETVTKELNSSTLAASQVEITTYFLDENGNEVLCPSGTTTFRF
jgi:hypothetical protein